MQMRRGASSAKLDVFIQLTRAADAIGAELLPLLAAEGLTAGQLGVLEAVVMRGPMSLRELGRHLFRSPPNMTIVVDNLERAALVRRIRSEADRRVVLVEPTAEGRQRFRRAYPTYTARIAAFMEALTTNEQAHLATLCEKLRERAEAHEGPRPLLSQRVGSSRRRWRRANER